MSVTHRTYCTGGTLSDLILWYVTQNLTDCQVKRDYDLICNRSCHWEACMVWTQIPINAGTNIHTHLFIKHNVLLQKQSLNQTCPISPQGEKEKKKALCWLSCDCRLWQRVTNTIWKYKEKKKQQNKQQLTLQRCSRADALPQFCSGGLEDFLWVCLTAQLNCWHPVLLKNYKNKTLH